MGPWLLILDMFLCNDFTRAENVVIVLVAKVKIMKMIQGS